ncbi:MAG: hypothetical protein FDZ70_03905 [Actinobacteria bacterium]|nr:MAG: hypothetical protein FDZ70_03905 [Actinomycetota bacterium]
MNGRMPPWARWTLLVAGLATCVALGYGAYSLAGYSWDQVATYESPFIGMLPDAPASALASPAPAPRLVLVIVDGLREDAARTMGTLNTLQGFGSDFSLVTPQPSLSYPDWTAILSGAPHDITAVTTNWYERPVEVPTLIGDAARAGKRTVIVGPSDLATLYPTELATASRFRDWHEGEYLTGQMVDDTLRLAEEADPEFVLLLVPDVDEAGHDFGGDSQGYAEVVAKVDADLSRLVAGLSDEHTAFVVVADHGHIDAGGHGGWEPEAVTVRAVFAGSGVAFGSGNARLIDVAPTTAALMGMGPPAYAKGTVIPGIVASMPPAVTDAGARQRAAFTRAYADVLGYSALGVPRGSEEDAIASADAAYQRDGRVDRAWLALAGSVACVVALAIIGIASRRALAAALAGVAAYAAVYNGLFFLVHGHLWSLSAFNEEDMVDAWMNLRLAEAAIALLVGAAVAALVYPLLRREPPGPRGRYLSHWLALGPATAIAVLAFLGLQVAWYCWAWGPQVTALLPDLKWAFKYDLDLLQSTAVGFAALLTPLVTYLVGRFHPKVRVRRDGGGE